MKILIIGGSSVAGQAVIGGIRSASPDAFIISTTSRQAPVHGSDETISDIDATHDDMHLRLADKASRYGELDFMFFMPAYGRVGLPVAMSNKEDIELALNYSYRPVTKINEVLKIRTSVGFTGFYWLPSLLLTYGSLAFAKHALEALAASKPETFKVIRAGMFLSKSIRGISLLLQRAIQKDLVDNTEYRNYKNSWKASGKQFIEYFADYAYADEKKAFSGSFSQPFRPTNPGDLVPSVQRILAGDKGPFFNVIGDWHWVEEKMQAAPRDLQKLIDIHYSSGLH